MRLDSNPRLLRSLEGRVTTRPPVLSDTSSYQLIYVVILVLIPPNTKSRQNTFNCIETTNHKAINVRSHAPVSCKARSTFVPKTPAIH